MHTEGIVLGAVPYKETSAICTLFTKECGKKTVIIHGLHGKNTGKRLLASPLCHGEYILTGTKKLSVVTDGSIYTLFPKLRASLRLLETATQLTTIIKKSQLEEKNAPDLFSLLLAFLTKLPDVSHTAPLHAGFLAKLLMHEGLFAQEHPDNPFTEKEWPLIEALAHERRFTALESLPLPSECLDKLKEWSGNCLL